MVAFDEQHVAGRDHAVRVDEILDVIGVEPHVALGHLDSLVEDEAIAVEALLYLRQDFVEARDVSKLSGSELGRRHEQSDGGQGNPEQIDHADRTEKCRLSKDNIRLRRPAIAGFGVTRPDCGVG